MVKLSKGLREGTRSKNEEIRRPGSACTVFFFLCRIQNLSHNPKSKIPKLQNPKSKIPKIQKPKPPKSKIPKIPKIQNPKSPKFGALEASHKDLLHNGPKSKIQNPQNPKSPKSKIQNPQDPKSKIRNPQIQNPKSPKSKIQNPQNPKSKIPEIWGHIKICYITVQNPKSKIPKIGQKSLDFGFWIGGFWILDFGPKIQNPKSPRSKIQNPKSKIPKIQNPKSPRSKIQNPQNPQNLQNPKSSAKIQNLGRWGPHIKICYITIKGDFGFWILDSGDFGFWILDLVDFGFWIWWILDFGSWGFWILGILDFADFGAFGRSRGCTTRQFGDGAWRSEARIPPGPPFRDSAKPTLSDIVGARKQIELQKPGAQEVKTIFYTFLHDF